MRVTKYVHSCLFIEEGDAKVLIDPGNYAAQEGFEPSLLPGLDYIVITHGHQDHCFVPLVTQLKEQFPKARILTNPEVVSLLKEEGIEAGTQGAEEIELELAPHERILGREAENSLVHVMGKLTHPGDSLRFEYTKEVLALPIQAPWGSMVASLERAASLRPRFVLPIHDWHWKDEARVRMYEMASSFLEQQGITLVPLEPGVTVDV